jgi:hypothetical protein
MGLLQENQIKYQRMLEYYNYELSEGVTNRKKEWEQEICKRIDKDDEDIVLDIDGFGITVEIEVQDNYLNEKYTTVEDIIKVAAYNGEVYVEDRNENEYYIDDLDERTFKYIYEAVMDLTDEDNE